MKKKEAVMESSVVLSRGWSLLLHRGKIIENVHVKLSVKNKKKKLLRTTVILFLSIAFLPWGTGVQADSKVNGMNVIDLSDWNENVDCNAVAQQCGGVIVKISEGCQLTELYSKRINEAKRYGLKWGVYCYTHATTAARARKEADTVIRALSVLDTGTPDLGIWFDVEAPEVIGRNRDDVTAICSTFIAACHAARYSAGIYASYDTLTNRIRVDNLAANVPYWVAEYGSVRCDFAAEHPNKMVAGWQKTDRYSISGQKYDLSEWFKKFSR